MPFFNWALLKSRTLHPDIGIPADDSQGLPYLNAFGVNTFQNYGLALKTISGTDSITGFLFTAKNRYLLGSGEALAIEYIAGNEVKSMFAIDSLSGHAFATTDSGIINNPIIISGNNLSWSGVQQQITVPYCVPEITFINYLGADFVGFGNSQFNNFAIFTPGGLVQTYSDYAAFGCSQPCTFWNGLYTILYSSNGYGFQYGFIPLGDAPEILPAYALSHIMSYSFSESALMITNVNGDFYGYDGKNDPELTSSFIKLGYTINTADGLGFDPYTGCLLSISNSIITVGGHAYYPVYVYNSVISLTTPTPQQYARPVKNFTVNGHLNWRKQR